MDSWLDGGDSQAEDQFDKNLRKKLKEVDRRKEAKEGNQRDKGKKRKGKGKGKREKGKHAETKG